MKLATPPCLIFAASWLGACPSTTPVVSPEPPVVHEADAEPVRAASDFESFLGLQRGDPERRIAELFGAPDASDPGDSAYRYVSYATGVIIGTDQSTDLVATIDVTVDDLPWLAERGVRDPRLALVGRPIVEIRALLGEPTRVHADNYNYDWQDAEGDGIGHVNFICYDFWEAHCREVQVQWFY